MDSLTIMQLFNSTLLLFSIIGLAALGGYFCERVGIINIAIDGQMIFGALIFSIFGQIFYGLLGNGSFILPMILAVIVSGLLSSVFGFLVIKLKCNHVIAGTAINLVIAGLALFLTQPLGNAISGGEIPKLKPGYIPSHNLDLGGIRGETIIILVITLLIIGISWFVISKTKYGLRFKAVGDNPNAVDAQGLNVLKYQWLGVIFSGVATSLAGAIFMYAGSEAYPSSSYFEGNVAGLGYLALAIVVAGQWKIPLIAIASFGFALLVRVFQDSTILPEQYQKIGMAIPFIASLLALGFFSYKSSGPKFIGRHFDKSLR